MSFVRYMLHVPIHCTDLYSRVLVANEL